MIVPLATPAAEALTAAVAARDGGVAGRMQPIMACLLHGDDEFAYLIPDARCLQFPRKSLQAIDYQTEIFPISRGRHGR